MFHEVGGYQAQVGIRVGKYADDTGSAADFPVELFEHIGGRNIPFILPETQWLFYAFF
jgi:hypothetical protein